MHTSLADLLSSVGEKMTGAGMSATVEDMVASPDLHSKIVAGVSFRRLFMRFPFTTFYCIKSLIYGWENILHVMDFSSYLSMYVFLQTISSCLLY